MKVAHLGPRGTFGEEAALRYAPGAELIALPSHRAVAAAVDSGKADVGVLAIENSINGSVAETLDILIHDTDLQIQRELFLPIEHDLVAKPGTAPDAIDVIYSHPQVFGQCRAFLERHYPEARLEAALSTAQAVELAMARERSAAMANARAAELYGAATLAAGIQDSDTNVTRFVVVGRSGTAPTGHDRTSIAFRFADDRPGLLAAVLTEFASRGINCSKMESRPARASFGDYVFLIDFLGHADDPECAEVLAAVRALTADLKVFGSYPRDEERG